MWKQKISLASLSTEVWITPYTALLFAYKRMSLLACANGLILASLNFQELDYLKIRYITVHSVQKVDIMTSRYHPSITFKTVPINPFSPKFKKNSSFNSINTTLVLSSEIRWFKQYPTWWFLISTSNCLFEVLCTHILWTLDADNLGN